MKKIIFLAALSFTITPLSFSASAKLTNHISDKTSTEICHAIQNDNSKKLHRIIKTNRIKITSVYNNVECNGNNIVDFSATNNAVNTQKYLNKKLSLPSKSI